MDLLKYMFYCLYLSLAGMSCSIEADQDEQSCHDYLEKEQWQQSIDCYSSGDYSLTPDPEGPLDSFNYLFYWAGAYGGKYGLAGSSIIDSLSDQIQSGEGVSSPIDITEIVAILNSAGKLPEAIVEMQRAIDLILQFPSRYRAGGAEVVYFENDLALISAVYASFLIELQKADFVNAVSNSELSRDELIAKADAVVDYLSKSTQAIGDEQLASAMQAQIEELDAQPGATTADKLENILGTG